ncbi:MAG: universal stress protein [Gammaproteobacteria bacterium]|nr:universal stress protein [Gammaproteobacteria bacterium]
MDYSVRSITVMATPLWRRLNISIHPDFSKKFSAMWRIQEDVSADTLHIRVEDAARKRLAPLIARSAGHYKEIIPLVEKGRAGATIVRLASEQNVDLVAMGAHGTSSLSGLFFGTTTYYVARRVHCSTMIIKPNES